jgi:hypothetical protein
MKNALSGFGFFKNIPEIRIEEVATGMKDHRVFKSGDPFGIFHGTAVSESGGLKQIRCFLRIFAAGPGKSGTLFLKEVFEDHFCSDGLGEKDLIIDVTGVAVAHGVRGHVEALVDTFDLVPGQFPGVVAGIPELPAVGDAFLGQMQSRIQIECGFGMVLAAQIGQSDVIENSVIPALSNFNHFSFLLI